MRSFRARRQESQWGLEEDAGAAFASDATSSASPSGGVSASATGGLRRGESLRSITMPTAPSRELRGGRLVNEDAVYNMRKKWISDRLIER